MKVTAYKVWIEIEEELDDGEDYNSDGEPECVGEFDTEAEAIELRKRLINAAERKGN